jgi:hypothetical protein
MHHTQQFYPCAHEVSTHGSNARKGVRGRASTLRRILGCCSSARNVVGACHIALVRNDRNVAGACHAIWVQVCARRRESCENSSAVSLAFLCCMSRAYFAYIWNAIIGTIIAPKETLYGLMVGPLLGPSWLLDARRCSTLLDVARRCSTLPDAARRRSTPR